MSTVLWLASLLAFQSAPAAGMADDKAAEEALATFKTAFLVKSDADRVKAIDELSETVHTRTLGRLSTILGSNEKVIIRAAAARAMGRFMPMKKQAVSILNGSLPTLVKEPVVGAAAIEALGALRDLAALPMIHKMMENPDGRVVRAALAAAAEMKNPFSIDPMIATLARSEKSFKANTGGVVQKEMLAGGASVTTGQAENFLVSLQNTIEAANQALKAHTNQDFTGWVEWQAWWNANRASYKPQ